MRKKYCKNALIIFMHNQPKNVIGVLLKEYSFYNFSSFRIRGYFETFFSKLIKYKDQCNHLQIIPYEPQPSYSDLVSSALSSAGGYVGSFFSSEDKKDDIPNDKDIINKNKNHTVNEIEHLGALNLDRLVSLDPEKKEDGNKYIAPANIMRLYEIMKEFNLDRSYNREYCK